MEEGVREGDWLIDALCGTARACICALRCCAMRLVLQIVHIVVYIMESIGEEGTGLDTINISCVGGLRF